MQRDNISSISRSNGGGGGGHDLPAAVTTQQRMERQLSERLRLLRQQHRHDEEDSGSVAAPTAPRLFTSADHPTAPTAFITPPPSLLEHPRPSSSSSSVVIPRSNVAIISCLYSGCTTFGKLRATVHFYLGSYACSSDTRYRDGSVAGHEAGGSGEEAGTGQRHDEPKKIRVVFGIWEDQQPLHDSPTTTRSTDWEEQQRLASLWAFGAIRRVGIIVPSVTSERSTRTAPVPAASTSATASSAHEQFCELFPCFVPSAASSPSHDAEATRRRKEALLRDVTRTSSASLLHCLFPVLDQSDTEQRMGGVTKCWDRDELIWCPVFTLPSRTPSVVLKSGGGKQTNTNDEAQQGTVDDDDEEAADGVAVTFHEVRPMRQLLREDVAYVSRLPLMTQLQDRCVAEVQHTVDSFEKGPLRAAKDLIASLQQELRQLDDTVRREEAAYAAKQRAVEAHWRQLKDEEKHVETAEEGSRYSRRRSSHSRGDGDSGDHDDGGPSLSPSSSSPTRRLYWHALPPTS